MSKCWPSTTRCAWAIAARTAGESGEPPASSRPWRRSDSAEAVAGEEVVVDADEEPGGARIALTAGTASELAVDAQALVAARAEDVQPAQGDDGVAMRLVGTAQADVGAAAGHVGRDRDGAGRSRPGDDRGLVFVVFGVQHDARDRRRAPSAAARASDSRTLDVPTSTGRPAACAARISATTARSFAPRSAKTTSG